MRMRKQKMWIERSKRTINDANFNKNERNERRKKAVVLSKSFIGFDAIYVGAAINFVANQ